MRTCAKLTLGQLKASIAAVAGMAAIGRPSGRTQTLDASAGGLAEIPDLDNKTDLDIDHPTRLVNEINELHAFELKEPLQLSYLDIGGGCSEN